MMIVQCPFCKHPMEIWSYGRGVRAKCSSCLVDIEWPRQIAHREENVAQLIARATVPKKLVYVFSGGGFGQPSHCRTLSIEEDKVDAFIASNTDLVSLRGWKLCCASSEGSPIKIPVMCEEGVQWR